MALPIDVKTTAALEDELFTTLLKCWFFQEIVMHSENVEEVAAAAKNAQKTNDRRNQLMRAIDERLGDGAAAALVKSYTHEKIGEGFRDAQRINDLENALQELYNAAIKIEQRYPVAREDWQHELFAATGNAFRILNPTNH